MPIYGQVSILSPQYLPTTLHREFANRNRRVEEELKDEEILSPLFLLLQLLRHRPDVDMPSISVP